MQKISMRLMLSRFFSLFTVHIKNSTLEEKKDKFLKILIYNLSEFIAKDWDKGAKNLDIWILRIGMYQEIRDKKI